MKLALISDTHGRLPNIPKCDILIHAGDICPSVFDKLPGLQEKWLTGNFHQWLNEVPSKYNVFVPGNHDEFFEESATPDSWLKSKRNHCLIERTVEIEGLKIWGSPWQTWFLDWAFNAPEDDLEETFLAEIFQKIPADVDIIVNHGPAYGIGDKTPKNILSGSKALLKRIEEIQPKLVVTGHIHCAVGVYQCGKTVVYNASHLKENYKPYGTPVPVFEI